jgi:hypothetical protein
MCDIIINITWGIVREPCRSCDYVIGTAKTICSGSSSLSNIFAENLKFMAYIDIKILGQYSSPHLKSYACARI